MAGTFSFLGFDTEAESGGHDEDTPKSIVEICQEAMDCLIKGRVQWDEVPDNTQEPTIETVKQWLTKYSARDETPTVLHALAKAPNLCGRAKQHAVLDPVVQHILEHFGSYREVEELSPGGLASDPILQVAIKTSNKVFINSIKAVSLEGYPELVHEMDRSGLNSAHVAFMQGAIWSLHPSIWPKSLTAKDKDGNTPLHYALKYPMLLRLSQEDKAIYVDVMKEILSETDDLMKEGGELNNQRESPYLYYLRTKKEYLESVEQSNQPAVTMKQTRNPPRTLIGRSNPASKNNQCRPPTYEESLQVHEPIEVRYVYKRKRVLIELNCASTRINESVKIQGQAQSTDSKQVAKRRDSLDSITDRPDNEWADEIADLFKRHYIRERSEQRARELIYRDTTDMNLSLNATNLENEDSADIVRLIQKLGRAGGFEKTLSFVKLPTIRHTKPMSPSVTFKKSYTKKPQIPHGNVDESQATGRSGLVRVFDELSRFGVTSILRLEVEDQEAPSHTDASIEYALSGKESIDSDVFKHRNPILVDKWNWKKPDLNLDVIAFAAPGVQEINLYWSGNSTTLQAWGSTEALERLKDLRKIVIHASPGGENLNRAEKLITNFVDRIINLNKQAEAKIEMEVRWISGSANMSEANIDTTAKSGKQGPNQHVWVKKMDMFRNALMSLHEFLECDTQFPPFRPARVQIGLIDDGVDLNKIEDFKNNEREFIEVTGISFDDGSWYESTGQHGTVMANMILRINPWAKIYSMRIKSTNRDDERKIDPDSAAKAIRAAVELGVDIISMSWTVAALASKSSGYKTAQDMDSENKTMESQAIANLRKAISFAAESQVLMFCSASDQIDASSMEMLPFAQAPSDIFRVGAARADGKRDTAAEDKTLITYYFPGNEVPGLHNERLSKSVEYHTGSSVATALAAGLASMILYCTEVVKSHWTPEVQAYEKYSYYRQELQKSYKMKQAFNNIQSPQWAAETKYLPVWGLFGDATEKLTNANENLGKLEALESLISSLVTGIK